MFSVISLNLSVFTDSLSELSKKSLESERTSSGVIGWRHRLALLAGVVGGTEGLALGKTGFSVLFCDDSR